MEDQAATDWFAPLGLPNAQVVFEALLLLLGDPNIVMDYFYHLGVFCMFTATILAFDLASSN